jgi:phosphoribosylformimino-5-aminoimidazole carboxamide ribotide isomerase
MIEIIPAIDLINGKCVRLNQGDFGRMTSYPEDPLDMARKFEALGIKRVHLVDLDGARTGVPGNLKVLESIARETSLKVDFGGGIRDKDTLSKVLESGAVQVSLGSLAVVNPDLLNNWIQEYGPGVFFIGADIRGGKIMYKGWQSESTFHWKEFIALWHGEGITDFFCTDVERDGELAGPATSLYSEMLKLFPTIRLVASGGVSKPGDLADLEKAGISAAIVGKAIYEGRIDLEELMRRKEE